MSNTKLLVSLMLLAVIFASETAYADRPRGSGGRATHGPAVRGPTNHGHASHGHVGRGHAGIGLYLGAPYAYPYYPFPYYPYSYYPPPVVVTPEPAQPPVYIEQVPSVTQQTSPDSYYWYYCEQSETYYPYVKECPSGWQRVSPTPPPQP